jgi:hypothetical protein
MRLEILRFRSHGRNVSCRTNSMTRRRKHSVCVPFAFPRMDLDRLRLSYPPLSAIFTGRGELRLAFRKHWNYWNVWNFWNGPRLLNGWRTASLVLTIAYCLLPIDQSRSWLGRRSPRRAERPAVLSPGKIGAICQRTCWSTFRHSYRSYTINKHCFSALALLFSQLE